MKISLPEKKMRYIESFVKQKFVRLYCNVGQYYITNKNDKKILLYMTPYN